MAKVRRIPLYARDGHIRAYVLVDDGDLGQLNQWRWLLGGAGYAVRYEGPRPYRRMIYMHRHILGLDAGDTRHCDHENRDRLDNRRSNLRVAPHGHADNRQNQGVGPRNTSGFRGVTKRGNRWIAQAQLRGVTHYLGIFDAIEEADTAARFFRATQMPFSEDARSAERK
jgi:hypothetical protein